MKNSILKLAGAFHWRKTSRIRCCALSYSMAEPCERSFHVIMYFMPFLYFQPLIVLTQQGASARNPAEPGGLNTKSVVCSKPFAVKSWPYLHSEIGLANCGISSDVPRSAGHHDPSGLENIGTVSDRQRLYQTLLHQQHRHPKRADARHCRQ